MPTVHRVWAQLSRRPLCTGFTLLAVGAAFELLGLLASLAAALRGVGQGERALRCFCRHFGVPTGAVGDAVRREGRALMLVLVGAVSVVPAWRIVHLWTAGGRIVR
ncbi:MAG: hypothetical protein ACP5P4_07535 [Steroidobacteraceae bacterium]